jgi:hypothetical protein
MFIDLGLFEFPDLTPIDFWFWCWLNSEVYKRKVAARRIARSHFGSYCPNKENLRLSRTNDTRSSRASCKLNSGLWWNFRTCIANCNKFVTEASNKNKNKINGVQFIFIVIHYTFVCVD